MLIHSASQLLTIAGSPQRGSVLGSLGIIPDGAVLFHDEKIMAVGTTAELRRAFPHEPTLDAGGKVVMPGFVDPHTHLMWAGDQAAEFEQRLQKKSARQSVAEGDEILPTVRAVCSASFDTLMEETRPRLWSMFSFGTTTAEAKTGYGLRTAAELRMLQALLSLDAEGPLELEVTFMGAHAVPRLYQGQTDAYVELVSGTMLPVLKDWWPHHAPYHPLPFVDVACRAEVFNLERSRKILETAVQLGFPIKIHADEYEHSGGARLAVELGAVSADHLVKTSAEDIQLLAGSNTVAVALPCIPFGLAENAYPPAQAILHADGLLALATGLNPVSAWCENMQLAIALACRQLDLTPGQAIAAATINAAAAIHQADRLGSLEVGKQADLLILAVSDYRHLGYRFGANLVQTVIKKGRIYPV